RFVRLHRQLLMMKPVLILLVAALLQASDEPPPIVELARTAPPEFFADAIVQLVRGGKVPSRDLQIELLEQAFAAAAKATEPIHLIAIPATPPYTRAIYRSRAADLNLDRLSLQGRILRELLTLDRKKARELFASVTRPILDPRPCEDPLIGD